MVVVRGKYFGGGKEKSETRLSTAQAATFFKLKQQRMGKNAVLLDIQFYFCYCIGLLLML